MAVSLQYSKFGTPIGFGSILMKEIIIRAAGLAAFCAALWTPVAGQQLRPSDAPAGGASGTSVAPGAAANYVIGVGDVLTITFWRDQRMSGDMLVRPDGKISVLLLNDVQAAGQTPEQLSASLSKAAAKFIKDESDVTVNVKEVHSRRVFIVGEVTTPGAVSLTGDMNVLQLIAVAGGLKEYADKKHIVILRTENGRERRLSFNYDDALKGKNLKQNVLLQPGDTVMVR
jgi:polysaccharide biosynthesis/export protein